MLIECDQTGDNHENGGVHDREQGLRRNHNENIRASRVDIGQVMSQKCLKLTKKRAPSRSHPSVIELGIPIYNDSAF